MLLDQMVEVNLNDSEISEFLEKFDSNFANAEGI